MTAPEIASLVTTIGFPSVAAYVTWIFAKARVETGEKAAQVREAEQARVAELREKAAAEREQKLVERVNHLEDSIRQELMKVVLETKDVVSEAKEVMSYCAGTLNACTVAMQDLKDASKRAAIPTT